MINFSSISQNSIAGVIMRFFINLIPKNTRLFILQGKLKWKKWIKGSGVNGYWLGIYELDKQKFFIEKVKKGDVVFDIGAQSGFYSLLAAELSGENGKVFSFEPLPQNIFYLKKNIEINNCQNIKVIEAAVSENPGILKFERGNNNFTGRIGDGGDLEVKAVSIDNLINKKALPIPNVIKIDVEGAEFDVLKGAQIALKNKPIIFLSIHRINSHIHSDCVNMLKNLSYEIIPIDANNVSEADEIVAF
jgi:FkbM family methyltransferase